MADADPRDKPIECPYTGKTVHREHCMKTSLTYQRGAWSPNRVFKDEATVTLTGMTETTEFYGKMASEIAGYTVYYEHGELPSASSQKYKHPLTFR